MSKQRRLHSAEQIVKKLHDADAMLAAGKSVAPGRADVPPAAVICLTRTLT